jgi:hypothetical protein
VTGPRPGPPAAAAPGYGEAADAVRVWAVAVVRRAETRGWLPRYGSPEWVVLPVGDPRRLAAMVLAAECWRDHCSPARVAADLAAELEYLDWSVRVRLAEASHDISGAADWRALTAEPSYAELQRRRWLA